MIRNRWLPESTVAGAMLLALATATASPADEATAPREISAPQVQVLIAQLAAGTRAARFDAEQQLVGAGEAVLPLLPSLDDVSHAAIREALQRIRARIELNAANTALEGTAFRSPQGSLAELLERLQTATGNPLDWSLLSPQLLEQRGPDGIEPGTFFSVLDAVCESLPVDWRWELEPRRIRLAPIQRRAVFRGKRHYDRAFRIALFEVRPLDNFVDAQVRQLFRLGMAVDVEPRLKPFSLRVVDADLEIQGPDGPLALLNPEAKREINPVGGRFLFPVDIAARLPDVPKEVSFSGTLTLRAAARPVPVEFRAVDITRSDRRVGPLRLWLDTWSATPDRLEIVLQVTFSEPMPELESHRQGGLHRDVVVTLPGGESIHPESVYLRSVDGLTHTVEYVFLRPAEGADDWSRTCRFVYVAPTLVTDVPLRFRFDHVLLPRD